MNDEIASKLEMLEEYTAILRDISSMMLRTLYVIIH